MADIKSLEHPTLKVPYEVLNKKFRSAQKTIDREVCHVQLSTNELEKCLQQNSSIRDVTRALDGMVEKLCIMKRKADESVQDEIESAKACKRRIEHLKSCENMSSAAASQWNKNRLDRMLVEYFLRSGYYKTAIDLARHSGIEDLTNIQLFLVSKEVEESLSHRDTAKCLTWCHDNKSKLRKMKSTLEFNVRQQEFVELIRKNQRIEAVSHARKYFNGVEENQLGEIQKVMGMLAFPLDTDIGAYRELLDEKRWNLLVQQFRHENFKLYQLNNHSVFAVTLQAGLSALKTPQCYKEDGSGKRADCPVCGKHLNELARKLPFAHCAQSRLICSIIGQPLNENNPPVMLPNGHVYGYNALVSMAADNNGKIICPATKDEFDLDDAEKVFVM